MLGARHAVLIASSTFPNEPRLQPLTAPEKDVEGMAAVLRAPERGCFSDVSVLKNRPHHEIIRSIQRTLNRAGRDDLVVLYYSGHGKLNRSGLLYLTALDTVLDELESSAIAVGSIRDFVDVSQSQRVVIILDCCFSGAIGGVFSKGSVDDQLQVAASEGRGTYIMTASTGIQTALEKETDQNSVFTKHLIAGIESGAADTNRNGTITADELYDYVYPRVREESHQEPTRWSIDVRGHFIISNSGCQPRKERAKELRTFLLKLADEQRITDKILTEALTIIMRPTESLSSSDRSRDALLDALRDKKIDAMNFLLQWVQIRKTRVNNSAKKQPNPASEAVSEASKTHPKLTPIQVGVTPASPSTEVRPPSETLLSAESPPSVSTGPEASVSVVETASSRHEATKESAGPPRVLSADAASRNPVTIIIITVVIIIAMVIIFDGIRPGIESPMKARNADPTATTEDDPIFRLSKDALGGDAAAQNRLGLMYDNGEGVPKDAANAVEWFRKSAEQGNAAAQYNLGLMYYDGYGVPEDAAKVVEWFRKSAEQGNADGQHWLGIIYYRGYGVPHDSAKAVEWYRKSAEQGNAAAQYNLGMMYNGGEGVPKDAAKAVEWFRKSAEQGNADAQHRLGMIYDNGKGVPKDAAKAVE